VITTFAFTGIPLAYATSFATISVVVNVTGLIVNGIVIVISLPSSVVPA